MNPIQSYRDIVFNCTKPKLVLFSSADPESTLLINSLIDFLVSDCGFTTELIFGRHVVLSSCDIGKIKQYEEKLTYIDKVCIRTAIDDTPDFLREKENLRKYLADNCWSFRNCFYSRSTPNSDMFFETLTRIIDAIYCLEIREDIKQCQV